MTAPPRWTEDQLEADRQQAIAIFRKQRVEEPLEQYLEFFDQYRGVVEDLLESTLDLAQLTDHLLDVLKSPKAREAFRYLAGPAISLDDLKVIAEADSLSGKRLKADPDMVQRIGQVVMSGLDRGRFPWVVDGREPTESEKTAAIVASAAMIANSRTQNSRRHQGKREQEELVRSTLSGAKFTQVKTRQIRNLEDAPGLGEFCGETLLGTRKADITIRLWDRRVMPIECKVSNSFTNSVKRLNNDAAVKAGVWIKDFGALQVVPAAVLSGTYKKHNLVEAQDRGLTLFWSHNLYALLRWIESTRQ